MTRCSAFCVASTRELAERASEAAGRMDRTGIGGPVTIDTGDVRTVALPLEGGMGFPLVHGWLGEGPAFEGSMAAVAGDSVFALRDGAGTRPLYVGRDGRWVASDHRFFRGEEKMLLPPGSRYELGGGLIKGEPGPVLEFGSTFEEAGEELASLLRDAVAERVSGAKKVAVAFSGGLDSSVLAWCAREHTRVIACTVYARGSKDGASVPLAAEALGLELVTGELSSARAKEELSAIDLPFEPSRMDRALWCVYSMSSKLASDCGAELILLGQLADELFGGYQKYSRAMTESGEEAAESLMKSDVDGCASRGLLRDEAACSRWSVPLFPFSDGRLLRFARSVPTGFKIRDGVRKAVLREAASVLGIPREVAEAPKKAAQYSSGAQKVIG